MTECCSDIKNEFVQDITVFINEQLDNGIPLKKVLELWDKTKKNKNELNVYIEKCK